MNNINKQNDIIAALATPYGKSAVAIIRISGNGAIELASRFLAREIKPTRLLLNVFVTEKFKERLMAVAYKAPNSYTGEETVELYPHGNMTICDGIMKTLVAAGARVAERGEFTKRAFLNGKLDLMQCEALADIIDSQTAEQLNYGNKRYDGGFTALGEVETLLKTALSSVEAVLHYSDELEENEIDDVVMKDVYGALDRAIAQLEKEKAGYAGGKIRNDGFKVALIGQPNVGKSTLLNTLTESERAIVTDIAGTTRDIIDGEYVYNDRKFIVIDTAGINAETSDAVEKIGIERAIEAAKNADAVVIVTVDGKMPPEISENLPNSIVLNNKCDETHDVGQEYVRAQVNGVLNISAKCGKNIIALKQCLYDMCPKDFGSICNHRQYDCVIRCLDSLKEAKQESEKACGLEIVAALLYEAFTAISELHGTVADESIITAVFERFCVGK